MTVDELVIAYLLDEQTKRANRVGLLRLLLRKDLPLRRWSKEGLFGQRSDANPSVIANPGMQRKGRPTVYLDGALARLDYIVEAERAGHRPKDIKKALERDVPQHALWLWRDEKVWRQVAARQMMALLTPESIFPENHEKTFADLWCWSPLLDERIGKLRANHPDADDDELEGLFIKDGKSLDLIPLGLYYDRPDSPSEFFKGLQSESDVARESASFAALVDALRNGIKGRWSDGVHVVRGCHLGWEGSDGRGRNKRAPDFRQPRPLTLLEFSHTLLRSIHGDVSSYLRRCSECRRYFAVADPQQLRCRRRACRKV